MIIEGYIGRVEGSHITYYCQPGLVPSEQMVATCTFDCTWSPDPAELTCALGNLHSVSILTDCGIPAVTSSIVILTNYPYTTTEGSAISFHCVDNVTLNYTVTLVCTNEGKWDPIPTDFICLSEHITSKGKHYCPILSLLT